MLGGFKSKPVTPRLVNNLNNFWIKEIHPSSGSLADSSKRKPGNWKVLNQNHLGVKLESLQCKTLRPQNSGRCGCPRLRQHHHRTWAVTSRYSLYLGRGIIVTWAEFTIPSTGPHISMRLRLTQVGSVSSRIITAS